MRLLVIFALFFAAHSYSHAEELDPPEILLGERLFLETRFAQYFAVQLEKNSDVNVPLKKGDPALDKTARFFGLPPYQIPFADGPYAGQSFNCRACHLVDEHLEQSELGMRSYSDYASRSPLPVRNDGMTVTVRNSPALVDASLPRRNFILHFDGEFNSLEQLVGSTLTNRNLGWLPSEKEQAIEHICKVMREDNGTSELAEEFGGFSYNEVFAGKTKDGEIIGKDYILPESLRINLRNSDCDAVFNSTVKLIAIYTEDLVFAQDESIISPYDLFLKINKLPAQANENETHLAYSKRLIQEIDELEKQKKLQFVKQNPNTGDETFQFHDQVFEFDSKQLAGMRIFFSSADDSEETTTEASTGNCIACHAAPHFTDFGIHNIGITQVEFDALHGENAFNRLSIPNLSQREKKADLFLPASNKNPERNGVFRKIPSKMNPMATDLGVWNILFNSDFPLSQESLYNLICIKEGEVLCKSRDDTLKKSIALFKTPGLRNLGHSAPYMHNGQISDLHAVISFYLAISINTRQGLVRNPDQDIANINIKPSDIGPLAAFLISLYEDYN
ncbi:MAG: hypothetical protein AAF304_00255 [Pseudomonadota bacterium]